MGPVVDQQRRGEKARGAFARLAAPLAQGAAGAEASRSTPCSDPPFRQGRAPGRWSRGRCATSAPARSRRALSLARAWARSASWTFSSCVLHVAAQFPGDGGGRSIDPSGDLANSQASLAQSRDPLPLQKRLVSRRPSVLRDPGRRDAAGLGQPPIPGLPANPELSTCHDGRHGVEDQPPVLVLQHQPPRTSGQQSKIGITLKAGITSEDAKKISKLIRDEGPKGVKAQIQGDELRVSSKKRDDLQAVQALVKAQDYDFRGAVHQLPLIAPKRAVARLLCGAGPRSSVGAVGPQPFVTGACFSPRSLVALAPFTPLSDLSTTLG